MNTSPVNLNDHVDKIISSDNFINLMCNLNNIYQRKKNNISCGKYLFDIYYFLMNKNFEFAFDFKMKDLFENLYMITLFDNEILNMLIEFFELNNYYIYSDFNICDILRGIKFPMDIVIKICMTNNLLLNQMSATLVSTYCDFSKITLHDIEIFLTSCYDKNTDIKYMTPIVGKYMDEKIITTDLIDKLIALGYDINHALYYFCEQDNIKIVIHLIESGANIHCKYVNPLEACVLKNSIHCAKLLLKNNVEFNDKFVEDNFCWQTSNDIVKLFNEYNNDTIHQYSKICIRDIINPSIIRKIKSLKNLGVDLNELFTD